MSQGAQGTPVASASSPDQVERRRKELHARVERDFESQPVGVTQAERIAVLRVEFKRLGHTVVDLVPAGREQSRALSNLEDALTDAIKGIAREGR